MPAYDAVAVLATDVDVTGTGGGTAITTAIGAAGQGVPGGRAMQFPIWFGGAITGATMTVLIEESIDGTNYRAIAVANFGTTIDPVATYASEGKVYTHAVGVVSPNATKLRYNISAYTGGGAFNDMNIAIVPFEGPMAPWGFPG